MLPINEVMESQSQIIRVYLINIQHCYRGPMRSEAEEKQVKKAKSQNKKYELHVKVATETKNSHELFDYRAINTASIQDFNLSNQFQRIGIYRNMHKESQDLVLSEQPPENSQGKKYVLVATVSSKFDAEFKCFRIGMDGVLEIPGIVVRKIKDSKNEKIGYQLGIGDVIRLGRARYLVRQISNGTQIQTYKKEAPDFLQKKRRNLKEMPAILKARVEEQMNQMVENTQSQEKVQKQEEQQFEKPSFNPEIKDREGEKICRICMDDIDIEDKDGKFLITPCVCKGSCRYIHFGCLKEWMSLKIKIEKRQHCLSFAKMQCEICKAIFPTNIIKNGKQHILINYEKPLKDKYIMLEKIDCERNKDVFILTKFPPEGLYLGRDSMNYIKIDAKNISVSRTHAYLKQKKGIFYLFDNQSRFGTLVQKDNFQFLLAKCSRGIQLDKSFCQFFLKKA